jgi:hypothetical protein
VYACQSSPAILSLFPFLRFKVTYLANTKLLSIQDSLAPMLKGENKRPCAGLESLVDVTVRLSLREEPLLQEFRTLAHGEFHKGNQEMTEHSLHA